MPVLDDIARVFRAFVVQGVPASGANEPDKAEIRSLLSQIVLLTQTGGAELPADLIEDIATVAAGLEGKVGIDRAVSGAGLATGGGALDADRTITVPEATEADAEEGAASNTVMTPRRATRHLNARRGAPNGVAALGPGSVIPVAQIPSLGALGAASAAGLAAEASRLDADVLALGLAAAAGDTAQAAARAEADAGIVQTFERRTPNVSPYQALPYAGIGPDDDIRLALDDKGRLLADIGTAYEAMGRTLFRDPSILHGVGFNGDLAHGRRSNGAPFDFGVARVPVPAIEVIGGRSRLVAYSPSGERTLLTGPDYDCFGCYPAYGMSARCVLNRPMYGPTRVVAVALDGSGVEIPDDPNMIVMLLGTGQSLMAASNGTDAYFHARALYPERTMMFESTVYSDVRCGLNAQVAVDPFLDPDTLVGFTPAVAKAGVTGYGGQDQLTAAASAMQLAAVRHCGKPISLLLANVALGGASQAQIGPGTNSWNNALAIVGKAVEFAEAEGKYVYVVVVRSHGETNATTASDEYAANEISHKDQLSTAIQAITGQQGAVPWVVSQWSSLGEAADNEGVNNTSVIGIQKAEALDPTGYMIVGPDYGDGAFYATDRVHFTGRGYTRKGERVGRALLTRIFGNTGKPALRWTSAVYNPATLTITATANREPGDLAIDTTAVPAQANHGLEVSAGSGVFKTISSVTLVGNTVEIVMAAPLVGPHMLNTGMLGHGTTRLPETQPRTNFRDNALRFHLVDGRPDPDWMIHQRNPIAGL